MNPGDILVRLAMAGLWLGGAAGAAGRDIPVYREYSRPIAFYDDQGELIGNGKAPDVHARRALRDAPAQENLLGKETLLDIAFPAGSFLRDSAAPKLSQPDPAAMEQNSYRRRNRREGASRNWLAGSLSLPSLGQTSSNAAASALGMAEEESNWGWLAGDVAAREEERQMGAEAFNSQEDPDAAAEQMRLTERAKEDAPGQHLEIPGEAKVNPGARARSDTEKKAEDPDVRRPPSAALPGMGDGKSPGEVGMVRAPADSGAGDMSQTRRLLAEISSQVRPPAYTTMQGSPEGLPAFSESKSPAAPPQAAFRGSYSRPDTTFSPGIGSPTLSAGSGFAGVKPRGGSWHGEWQAQPASDSLSSYISTHSGSTAVKFPAPTVRGNLKPTFTSGAPRPGWY